MNYPVWFLPGVGGGLLIAIIAVVHVFISHFAVGVASFLCWPSTKPVARTVRPFWSLSASTPRLFLLVTMVAGGMTGVAIWFVISLVHPGATSLLIHLFVFGWAAEWVFFLVEIVALLIYYYQFDRLDPKTHLAIGWIYFIAGWMSLFLINGIIGFMLTPGDWLQNQSFWSAFFNPTFWPSLFFRSMIAFMLAVPGLF